MKGDIMKSIDQNTVQFWIMHVRGKTQIWQAVYLFTW